MEQEGKEAEKQPKEKEAAAAAVVVEKKEWKPEEDPRFQVTVLVGARSECIPDDKLLTVLMKQNKLPGEAKLVSCTKPESGGGTARKLVFYADKVLLPHMRSLPDDHLLSLVTSKVSFTLHVRPTKRVAPGARGWDPPSRGLYDPLGPNRSKIPPRGGIRGRGSGRGSYRGRGPPASLMSLNTGNPFRP